MRRLAEWIETHVKRMREENDAHRNRIVRKRFPPELAIRPDRAARRRFAKAASRSRSQSLRG